MTVCDDRPDELEDIFALESAPVPHEGDRVGFETADGEIITVTVQDIVDTVAAGITKMPDFVDPLQRLQCRLAALLEAVSELMLGDCVCSPSRGELLTG